MFLRKSILRDDLRRGSTLYREDVEGFDPFREVYLYGDERAAAEDVFYVYFQVWKLPPDSPLYVTAAGFRRGFSYEQSVRI